MAETENEVKFVNLTPHVIRVRTAAGDVAIPPSGTVAHCTANSAAEIRETEIGPVRFSRTIFGAAEGIPAPEDGTIFIASTIAAQSARRPDVVSPDSGRDAIRVDGQVFAVLGFQTFD